MTSLTKPVLEMNVNELNQWWKNYQKGMLGWNYLKDPAPKLMTTLYAEMVVEGDIPASKENILAANRHLKDLKRQDDADFPWRFDESRAWRPIRFIEEKCQPSKGDFNKIVMQPWQHFVIGSLCGWVSKDTGYRRYREAVIFVGRKNGKTTFMSGFGDYMTGWDGEKGADVYFLANSMKQAGKLFGEAKNMIDASDFLSDRFVTTRSEIRHPKTKSTIYVMSSEKHDKDGENAHFVAFDEIHAYKDYDLINVMKRSRGTRNQPLIVYITTAGTVLDGPLMNFVEAGKECLENYDDDLDERTFYFLAKLDSADEINDPEMWIKANPNMCLMKTADMITDFKQDRRDPAQLSDWVTKQFNLFSDTDELSFVSIDTLNRNNKSIDLNRLAGRECIGGFDLSETEDFTAAALEFPLDDGSVYAMVKSWIPQRRYDEDSNQRRLDEWVKSGDLEIIPGDYVNYQYVLDWFKEQSRKYRISVIKYDPAKALQLNQALHDYGFVTDETRQGFITLSGPLQNLKELFLDGKVIFNNSKIMRWYINNVRLVKDRNDNWLPSKQSRRRQIDGFAALLDAHVKVVQMLSRAQSKRNISFVSFKNLQ
ncbi:terminase large subunit [Furfurilactobacillus entadae]|uniref:terminase large subunit n=1 Tax=Furfurilactobacillus entadae TaxID=2922307 RepID=UPI0035E67138